MTFGPVLRFDTLPSTSDTAKELARDGAGEGTTVVAAEQTMGRGTRGRVWLGAPGDNLYASVILRPQVGAERVGELAFVAAIAVARAVRSSYGLDARIKWPNDVRVGGRKIAGILVEVSRGAAVVGIGLNLNLMELPEEIAESATSVRIELGRLTDIDEAVASVSGELESAYKIYKSDGFAATLDAWRALEETTGTDVTVRWSGGVAVGRAVEIDETGGLVIETLKGEMVTIPAGIIL